VSARPQDRLRALAARFADLRQRIVSGVALGLAAFLLLWAGGFWAAALVGGLAGAMAWEWRTMVLAGTASDAAPVAAFPPVLSLAGAVAAAHFVSYELGFVWLMAGLGAGLGSDIAARRRAAGVWSLAGGAYIGIACLAFLMLREYQPFGFLAALWVILVVAASDIGGYFAGRLIGGARLWPAVSPKKTWSGLGGGVALAALVGAVFSALTTGTYFHEVSTVSAAAALLAQAGDLAESAAKRHFGVKDSSGLIPGHGGVLDRCDGLMAATLVAAAVTFARGQTVFVW